MSQSTTTSAENREVVHDAAPISEKKDTTSPASVLITEQEVLLGTRAAALPEEVATHRGWIESIRAAVGSLHLPPPRQRYFRDSGYLERARMGREMDRL